LDNVQARIWGLVLNDLRSNVTGYTVEAYYPDRETWQARPEPRPVLVTPEQSRVRYWLETLKQPFRAHAPGGNGGDRTEPPEPPAPEA
jgi:hypothetical protein